MALSERNAGDFFIICLFTLCASFHEVTTPFAIVVVVIADDLFEASIKSMQPDYKGEAVGDTIGETEESRAPQ